MIRSGQKGQKGQNEITPSEKTEAEFL